MLAKLKSLKNHQGFKKYFANTSWLFIEKILRMVVGLFVGIWVARYLGPEKFGLLSYAQSFVGLFGVIATLGLDGILVREIVKYPEEENKILGTAFVLKLLGAMVTLLVLYIAIHFTSNSSYTNTLIFIIASAVIFQAFNVIDMYFQAKVMSKYIVFANSFSLLTSSIVKILLILNEASLIYFAYVVVFDSIVMALGYIYFFIKNSRFKIQDLKFNKSIAINLLKDSWPLIIAGLGYVVYSKIDQLMLFNYTSAQSVGFYIISVNFINIFIFIPTILVNSLFPHFTKIYNKNSSKFYQEILIFYRYIVFFSFFVIIVMYMLGSNLILFLYGPNYEMSSKIMFLVSISFLFESLATINGRYIWIHNLQIISLYRTLFGALLNIILNMLLIPEFGIRGAIYATLITLFLSVIVFYLFFKNTRKLFYIQFIALISFFNLNLRSFKHG